MSTWSVDEILQFLAKLAANLGIEMVSQVFAQAVLGKPGKASDIQEAIEKWMAGDKSAAQTSMLRILPGGFGKADEMRVAEDLAILLIDGTMGQSQFDNVSSFLVSLSDDERRKFRSGYAQQGSERHRFAVLMALANSRSDDARRVYLEGDGFFELNMFEIGVNYLDTEFEAYNLALDARIKAAIKRRDNPPRSFGVPNLGASRWIWLGVISLVIVLASVIGNCC